MSKQETYNIPYIGLKREVHTFNYQLDGKFFKKDEYSLIQDGKVDVKLIFDKSNTPYILDFDIRGIIQTNCDRCTTAIDIPIQGNYKVYVKFDQNAEDIEDEDMEILFLHPENPVIDIETYLYDFPLLSIPYSKVCEDVGLTCDPEFLKYIQRENEEKLKETENIPDPRWAELNKLKDLK
ncbi:MAG: DUF177 domain-containing protein [Chitinophagales bacterium]|nr:DUF177 domain-containing protein [Chitinophagales bacterium]MCZ2392591.1 DUF177 domain-containing protein [Chitinophagales bacterium]